jgi:hypothetical protein
MQQPMIGVGNSREVMQNKYQEVISKQTLHKKNTSQCSFPEILDAYKQQ